MKENKAKSLDLKEDELKKEFEKWYYSKKFVPLGRAWTHYSYEGFKFGIDFVKQRIKSACEFYLRYKDNPELFLNEIGFPKDSKGIEIFNHWKSLKLIPPTKFTEFDWHDYNEWLFKLAFKDVFEEGENERE